MKSQVLISGVWSSLKEIYEKYIISIQVALFVPMIIGCICLIISIIAFAINYFTYDGTIPPDTLNTFILPLGGFGLAAFLIPLGLLKVTKFDFEEF